MTKRQKAAEEKRQQEIAAIERELRLIAYGANGGCDIAEEEDGLSLFGCMSPMSLENYLSAIFRLWKREGGCNWWIDIRNLAKFDTIASGAEWMHSQGARAGGEWEE